MSSCNNLRRERWKRDDDTINWNEPTDEIRVLHSSYASATPDGWVVESDLGKTTSPFHATAFKVALCAL